MARLLFFLSLVLSNIFIAHAAPPPPQKGGKGSTRNDSVRWLGRVNPATQELTWPGTGLSFNFVGTTATIGIEKSSGTNSFDLIIDDGTPTLISTIGSAITTPKLKLGLHSVTLRRRSETILGTVTIGVITADGRIAPTVGPSRQIEFVGDSTTVGYGLDGTAPCVNTAALENNPKTFAALAAGYLHADYHMVAYSGKGLLRNYESKPDQDDKELLLPQLFLRYGANDADNSYTFPDDSWSPAAVVITLGTNDFGHYLLSANGTSYSYRPAMTEAQYAYAMRNFALLQVRKRYPDAEIFLVGSPMISDVSPAGENQKTVHSNALKSAVQQIGKKAHFVEWPSQGSAVGCDGHPNANTHADQALKLALAIGDALGW